MSLIGRSVPYNPKPFIEQLKNITDSNIEHIDYLIERVGTEKVERVLDENGNIYVNFLNSTGITH